MLSLPSFSDDPVPYLLECAQRIEHGETSLVLSAWRSEGKLEQIFRERTSGTELRAELAGEIAWECARDEWRCLENQLREGKVENAERSARLEFTRRLLRQHTSETQELRKQFQRGAVSQEEERKALLDEIAQCRERSRIVQRLESEHLRLRSTYSSETLEVEQEARELEQLTAELEVDSLKTELHSRGEQDAEELEKKTMLRTISGHREELASDIAASRDSMQTALISGRTASRDSAQTVLTYSLSASKDSSHAAFTCSHAALDDMVPGGQRVGSSTDQNPEQLVQTGVGLLSDQIMSKPLRPLVAPVLKRRSAALSRAYANWLSENSEPRLEESN